MNALAIEPRHTHQVHEVSRSGAAGLLHLLCAQEGTWRDNASSDPSLCPMVMNWLLHGAEHRGRRGPPLTQDQPRSRDHLRAPAPRPDGQDGHRAGAGRSASAVQTAACGRIYDRVPDPDQMEET